MPEPCTPLPLDELLKYKSDTETLKEKQQDLIKHFLQLHESGQLYSVLEHYKKDDFNKFVRLLMLLTPMFNNESLYYVGVHLLQGENCFLYRIAHDYITDTRMAEQGLKFDDNFFNFLFPASSRGVTFGFLHLADLDQRKHKYLFYASMVAISSNNEIFLERLQEQFCPFWDCKHWDYANQHSLRASMKFMIDYGFKIPQLIPSPFSRTTLENNYKHLGITLHQTKFDYKGLSLPAYEPRFEYSEIQQNRYLNMLRVQKNRLDPHPID